MVANHLRMIAAGCVACAALAAPDTATAQTYGYDEEPAVVVECAPGQRAVMAQRRVNGVNQVVARCEGTAQTVRASRVSPARTNARYVERVPARTKTKTALMIAGSAATGAGVGGALKGKKGAIVGAAIGGGSASIYEAAKRR
jgi:hypothetical protein